MVGGLGLIILFNLNRSIWSTQLITQNLSRGAVMVVIVWWLDLQLPMQSVPITTEVVSLNPVHGEVYSIQHYVIMFVSDLRQGAGFLRVLWFPPI